MSAAARAADIDRDTWSAAEKGARLRDVTLIAIEGVLRWAPGSIENNKTAARTRIIALKAEKLRGDFIDPRDGRITLADWLDVWWPVYAASVRPSTLPAEEARMRNHIRSLLGHLALDEIDSMVIQRWIATLLVGKPTDRDPPKLRRRKLKPKTVHNCHGLLHRILGAAVKGKKIRHNPCTDSSSYLPEIVPVEMRFLTEPEAARLVAAVPKHWRPLVLLLIAHWAAVGRGHRPANQAR